MTWPTDTEQIATINEQAERIHQLEDQVARLQAAFIAEIAYANEEARRDARDHGLPHEDMIAADIGITYGLRPTDLDPIE